MHMKRDKILNWIIISIVVIFVAIFAVTKIVQKHQEELYAQLYAEQQLQKEKEQANDSIWLMGGDGVEFDLLPTYDVLLTPDECMENIGKHSYDNRDVTIETKIKSSHDDNLLLYFEAVSVKESNKITIEIASYKNKFEVAHYAQTQTHAYYIPIKNFPNIYSIKFSIAEGKGGVAISNVMLVNAFQEEIPNEYHASVNIDESVQNIALIGESGIPVTGAQDIICDDKYAYIGNINNVYIASIEDYENPKIISSITDTGTVRRLELTSDKKTLVVASREYGVSLIDVNDPENPAIISHIDTLELASGLDIIGNYLFIASRYYGIEIYDITDPSNPVFCSSVKSNNESECIDCKVYGDYLYAGVWATRRIEVFDISDISRPEYITYIETDGNAYGLDIHEDNLIVATGFHSGINAYDTVDDYGYGTGNGISIYSLANPKKPAFLSTAKSDYRYYYIGMDYWNVKVSGGFAYLSDLYGGLYIYDVRDGKNPVRMAKVTIPILSDSPSYVDMSGKKYVYGFNPKEQVQSPVTGVGITNGYIYITNTLDDVYALNIGYATVATNPADDMYNSASYCYDDINYSYGYATVKNYPIEGQTYVVDQFENYLYVGTSSGVQIFDTNMQKVGFYKTTHAVRDLKIVNGKLYTAEGLNGISIYQINGTDLTLLGNYVPRELNRSNVCSQLGVSPDGRYVVTSCRLDLTALLNVSDPENIVLEQFLKSGAVYYRNIADGYVNNTIYISHGSGVSELIFDEAGGYKYNEFANLKYFYSSAGFAALDNKRLLAVCNKGYQVLDVSEGFENVKESELVYLGSSAMLKGSPSVNANLLCVAFPAGGQITVMDITDVDNPVIKANFKIEGCPDTAYISDDGVIYIPCRYEGIKRITVD